MRLVSFTHEDGQPRVGAVLPESRIVDLTAAGVASDMVAMIRRGAEGLADAERAVATSPTIDEASVVILAPIPRPPKNVMCVGRNYRDHAQEFSDAGFDASERQVIPDEPIIFTKAATSIIGPGEPIVAANDPMNMVDYEGELGVVVGLGGRGIAGDGAFDHVYGYTVINDVTARGLQKRHVQFFIGKTVDTFCPMGPHLVTRDEVGDVTRSWLRTHVNGELRQEAPLSALIFDIPRLIATLSESMTLEPGDVIATGTPVGTGMGFDPPKFLVPGDIVTVSVDGVGTLTNPVA